MTFTGWPLTAIQFFEGLEADNSKAYWQAHRDQYDSDIKAPMDALLAELQPELGEPKLFRPYRDIRFSRDKSPYKINIAATIGDGYVSLSSQGLAAGSGMYHMAPDQIDRYRQAVAADATGQQLQSIVDALTGGDVVVYGSDALKTAPRGHSKDHPRVELLKYRGIVAMKQWPVENWLSTAVIKDRIVEVLRKSRPLMDWLNTNVGDSTMTDDPRRR